jgi:LemA protein
MKANVAAVLALVVILVLVGGCTAYQGYRRAITLDEQVRNNWAQVENQLQRRYDLIPNLVATVKGVAGQEQKVFGEIAEARKAYGSAQTQRARAEAANEVESALGRLLLIVENYPQLRSNESFLKLQDQLEGTENRLSVERQRYNESVRELNTFIRPFPGSFYARLAGVEPAEYFKMKAAARETPGVDFSQPAAS